MTNEEMVTITKKEYDKLLDDSIWLNCLVNAGVDNWHGYPYAMEEYNNNDEDWA